MPEDGQSWPRAAGIAETALRTTVMLALITAVYYALPLRGSLFDLDAGGAVSIVVVLAGLTGFALLLRKQLATAADRSALAVAQRLLTALYLLIFFFAVVYYAMNQDGREFADLDTKTDALYFAVTVTSTVGFGDVHAIGQTGRVVVTLQMIFNVVYVGTAIRLLSRRLERGA